MVHALLVLAAEEAEPSKTAFYVLGGVLAVWAVVLGFIGLRSPEFPGSERGVARRHRDQRRARGGGDGLRRHHRVARSTPYSAVHARTCARLARTSSPPVKRRSAVTSARQKAAGANAAASVADANSTSASTSPSRCPAKTSTP